MHVFQNEVPHFAKMVPTFCFLLCLEMSQDEGLVKHQAENIELRSRGAKLEEEVQRLAPFEGRCQHLTEELSKAKKEKAHVEATLKKLQEETATNKRNLAELISLRREVQNGKKREEQLQAVIDQVNEQLDTAGEGQGATSASDAEVERRCAQLREELEQKAEEEVFAMTVELEETIEKQRNEIEDLKKQLESAGSRSDSAAVERAIAEKVIALRVKDGALAECGQTRAELEKSSSIIADLRSQIKVLESQLADARSASPRQTELPTAAQLEPNDSKSLKAQLQEKEKLVQYLKDRVSDLEVRSKTADGERDAAVVMKSKDFEELERQNQALKDEIEMMQIEHQGELDRLRTDLEIVEKERDKALAAGRRAFLERNTALSEAKAAEQKREQLARLHKKSKEDLATVKTVMGKVETNYDEMVSKMESADTADERKEVIYDKLFDYEHRIWNLNNDLESLTAIRKIREQEAVENANTQWASKCEEYMSAIEILRMQIRELDKEPLC